MKNVNVKIGVVFAIMLLLTNSCREDFLDVTPNGALDDKVLSTDKGVDALLISAYSMLDGVASNGFGWEAASSNWVYGSIRGLEANKGTDSGDQPDINPIQQYNETSTNPYLNVKWRSIYDGIARANAALTILAKADAAKAVTADQKKSFNAQARALRGYFHLEAFRMWGKSDGSGIVYMTESTDYTTAKNDTDVRPLILADLKAGADDLNLNMGQIGRFNKTVAQVLYAKALMQLNRDYAGAKTILASVVGASVAPAAGTSWSGARKPDNSAIGLAVNYGDIFDAVNRNSSLETVYTVQYSVNDGSGGWNGGWGEVLNFPYKPVPGSPGGCCGFFQPSFDLVNSFKTNASGLPLLDNSYASSYQANDQGLTPAQAFTPDLGPNLDLRLDWTVGRRGIEYLDWGKVTGSDWIRDQSYAGPYSPKKQVYRKSQTGTQTEVGNWTSGWTTNGYRLIRAADVVLLLAECQIETGETANGVANINRIRARAAGSAKADPAVNYNVGQYGALDQATARLALRMERKLELGMEGHRFFDLQRWGNVQAELNRILPYEKAQLSTLYGPATVGPEDVNYPVPQDQIDVSKGNLKQNR